MENLTLNRNINEANEIYAQRDAFAVRLREAAKAGKRIYENQVNLLNNCKYARQLNNHHSLQDLFIQYWDGFLKYCKKRGFPIRKAITDNVKRMIQCRDLSVGFLHFDCPKCSHYHIQGLSCHSRFCASCGKKYRDARTLAIAEQCLDVPHRQFVFSIPDTLRVYFRNHRTLLNLLFTSVHQTFDWINHGKSKRAKKENRQFGYVLFLHTFGRDLKFNPHIHALIAEATIDQNGKRRKHAYFSFEALRKSFMKQLLANMKAHLKPLLSQRDMRAFYALTNRLYKQYQQGFYTHGPKKQHQDKSAVQNTTEYIARYAGHPAISESRIIDINETDNTITYYYDPHEDDHQDEKRGRQIVTEHVYKFIAKLIVHIPDKHFHTIRRYGFYANHSRHKQSTYRKLYNRHKLTKMKRLLDWRQNLRYIYKYDPLLCVCGSVMELNLNDSCLPQKHLTLKGG